jgi:hypothetical protein
MKFEILVENLLKSLAYTAATAINNNIQNKTIWDTASNNTDFGSKTNKPKTSNPKTNKPKTSNKIIIVSKNTNLINDIKPFFISNQNIFIPYNNTNIKAKVDLNSFVENKNIKKFTAIVDPIFRNKFGDKISIGYPNLYNKFIIP